MRRHAEDTKVPVSQTRDEIEQMVKRHGATGFSLGWDDNRIAVTFDLGERRIRFVMALPDDRNQQEAKAAWRRLRLNIAAKLEAVADGATVEEAFLAETIVPRTGRTVAEMLLPQLAEAYRIGGLPPLLELPGEQLALPPARRTRIEEAA